MLPQIPHKPHGLSKAKTLPKDPHERAEAMLRELAFVMKMTQQVREELEMQEDVEELALA